MFDANADHGSGERLLMRLVRRVRLSGRRPGAVLAMVALSLVGLVGAVALAIDLGMLFSARAEAQRVADAAALAGASAFIDIDPVTHPAQAQAAALARTYDYATRQSLLGEWVIEAEVTPMIVMDSQKVRVRIRRETVPLFFARIFGIQLGTAHAVAAAEAVRAGSTSCLKPFAIPDMWNLQNPEQDIYRRTGIPAPAPIWDFDAHITPNQNIIDSGQCVQRGQRWDCPPEVWQFDGNYTSGNEDTGTGYGTKFRDNSPDYRNRTYTKDEGRRVPMKINFPTEGPTSSFWFPWRMPGSAGTADFKEALKGCVEGEFNIGEVVNEDGVETENGLFPKPTYDAIIDLIDNGYDGMAPDRNAYWDEAGDTIAGSSYSANPMASPRVITVAVFHPADMTHGHTSMRFVDFATFFLEDPRVVYPGVSPAHHAPITGRLVKFTSGQAGPAQGNLVKRLRLVE
jgi:hypothetical protein